MATKYLVALILAAAGALADGDSPGFKTDPRTTKYCTFWYDSDGGVPCQDIVDSFISGHLADFVRWNPSITPTCGNLQANQSYCVQAATEPKATTTSTTSTSESTTTAKTTMVTSTTTMPSSNGITTPTPTQPGMVDNCNLFHYIYKGNTCDQITSYHGISQADFTKWNPRVGSQCTGLQADAFACVGVIGGGTTTPTPTSTQPPNGITTPTPTQPGMITSYHGISQADFAKWNPQVKADCTGLWSDAYACVGVIGGGGTPTTTSTGNGVPTPTPTQPDMVSNCNAFHYIYKGNTCDQITSYHGISQADFARWNLRVGADCSGLWSDAYACVGVIGGSTPPTNTQPNNGVATPTPTQPHMVTNCNTFHYIYKGNTCGQITSYHGITQEQFARWNPDVGVQCTGLWADAYACVGVIGG